MKKHSNSLVVGGIVLFLIMGWFYWFQWRPAQIRKGCMSKIQENAQSGIKYTMSSMTVFYRMCLTKQGLKPEDLIPSSLLN